MDDSFSSDLKPGVKEGDSSSSGDEESDTRSLSFTSDSKRDDDQFGLNVSFTGGYVPNTDL